VRTCVNYEAFPAIFYHRPIDQSKQQTRNIDRDAPLGQMSCC
jgi:hypothetical protein